MTLQQLEYILAVDRYRHFGKAAEACNVTQPTLSAMIGKLEEELNAKLFDRNQQPICPTPIGGQVISQARQVLQQADSIKDIVAEEKQSITGIFRVGILPTIAPYLLPRFFPQLMTKYPALDIRVREMKTHEIKEALIRGDIDAGILATIEGLEEYTQLNKSTPHGGVYLAVGFSYRNGSSIFNAKSGLCAVCASASPIFFITSSCEKRKLPRALRTSSRSISGYSSQKLSSTV